MTRLVAAGGVAIALATAVTACSSGDDAGSAPTRTPLVERGAEVYAASCASCHGADLQGTDRGPSHLAVVYEPGHHPDEAFRAAIANGAAQHHWAFGPMPPVEGLGETDVDAVIAFIRAEQERQGFRDE